MRKKTIAAFAAVYISLCLTYGLINGINLPASSEETEAVSVTTSVSEESSAAETTQQSTSEGRKKKRSKSTAVTTQPESYEEEIIPEEKVTEQTETEAPPAVPTLDEYLSKLKCGGCGHGCTLLNPRCMRGARKQSSAESEYYSLYG